MRQRLPLAVLTLGLAACAAAGPKLGPALKVDHVIDGDTIVVVKPDGLKARVRLAGVDAPETPAGRQGKAEPCGTEATEYLTGFLHGAPVYLEGQGADRYGREVAFVWVRGEVEVLVNAEMVRSGYTRLALPLRSRWTEQMAGAQGEAQDARRGLWGGDCK